MKISLLIFVLITALFAGCEKRSGEMQSVEDTEDITESVHTSKLKQQ